jgi:large subunit ribosomal protein L29
MKSREMRDMTMNDLRAKLGEMTEELFKLKFRLTTQPLDNPLKIRMARRDIARLNTFIRQKEVGAVAQPTAAPAKRASAKAPATGRAKKAVGAQKRGKAKAAAKRSGT